MGEIETRNAIAGHQGSELAELAALLKHAERGAWAFAVYNTVAVREETTAALRQLLAPLAVHDFTLSPTASNPLAYLDSLAPAEKTGRAIVFFFDAERAGEAVWGFLESQREALGRYPHGLVFWVTPTGRREALRRASNFWSQRSGVFDFTVESPQVLTQMQERWAGQPVRIESAADVQRQIRLYEGLLNEYRDRTDVAATARLDLHEKLGRLYEFAGRWEEAVAEWQAELKLAQESGNRRAEAGSLHNMGIVAQDRGEYDAALDYYRRSQAILEALGDRAGASASLHQMGIVAQARGEYDAALDYYRRSLDIAEAMGDRAGVSASLHQIGTVAQERGEYDAALDYYRRSLDIDEALGDRGGVSKSLHAMGIMAQRRGEYDAALDYYRRSLDTKEAMGDRAGVSAPLHQMGIVAQLRGEYDAALDYYQRSLAIREALGDRAGVSQSLHQMGMVAQRRGEYDAALDYYRRSLDIKEALGDRAGTAITCAQMALLHEQLGQLDRALALIRQAEVEFARMGAAQLAQARQARVRIEVKLSGKPIEKEPQGLALEQLVGMVVAGCKGDAQAGQQAYDIAQALQRPGSPQEYIALGMALQRLLEGLRDYDEVMRGLPPELGDWVRQVLEQIR